MNIRSSYLKMTKVIAKELLQDIHHLVVTSDVSFFLVLTFLWFVLCSMPQFSHDFTAKSGAENYHAIKLWWCGYLLLHHVFIVAPPTLTYTNATCYQSLSRDTPSSRIIIEINMLLSVCCVCNNDRSLQLCPAMYNYGMLPTNRGYKDKMAA